MANSSSALDQARAHAGGGSQTPAQRKAGLSCAECRRSKLKCDRVFPCQSCIRRGCGNICPDGVLAATKGNKILMARAEKLSVQVKSMAARIAELERALADTDVSGSRKTARLPDATVKWEDPSDGEVPTDSDDEVASAASPQPEGIDDGAYISPNVQHLKALSQGPTRVDNEKISPFKSHELGLTPELVMLVNAFPLGPSEPHNIAKDAFLRFVPPRERSLQLFEVYYTHTVIYQPVSSAEFRIITDSLYGPSHAQVTNADGIAPHALALFFIILSFGTFFEGQAYAHAQAEAYHALSRAAVALQSLVHQHSLETVQSLFLINLYKLVSSRPSTEWRWIIGGVCARVVQGMGLQRDCALWITDSELVQRRRVLFWEIFVFENWTGVLSSRPPALNIRQTNCRFPEDRESVEYNGELEISYHAWKYRYTAACLSLAVQHVFNARNPTYGALLDLDAKIRRFPLPIHLRTPIDNPPTPWAADSHAAMKQHAALIMLEGTLLYLHRAYLPLISSGNASASQPKFGRSVWACYRSASRMVRALKSLYQTYPERTSKVWYFWSAMYTSSIALGALITERPHCQLAGHALAELEATYPVYEEGSAHCAGPATRDILRGLLDRVRSVYAAAEHGPRHGGSEASRTPCADDCCARLTPAEVADFARGRDRWFAPPPAAPGRPSSSNESGDSTPPGSGSAGSTAGGLVGHAYDHLQSAQVIPPPPLPAMHTFHPANFDQLYPLGELGYHGGPHHSGPSASPLSAHPPRSALVPPTPEQVRFPPPHPAQREEPHITMQPISYPYGWEQNPATRLPQYQYEMPPPGSAHGHHQAPSHQQAQQQQSGHHQHSGYGHHGQSPTTAHNGYSYPSHEQHHSVHAYSSRDDHSDTGSWNNYVSIIGGLRSVHY